MRHGGDARSARRTTRLAPQPQPLAVDEDDEDSMDLDVVRPKRNISGRRRHDPEDEDYDSKEQSGRRKKGSRQKSGGAVSAKESTDGKNQRKKTPVHDIGVILPHDEMLQNCLLYLLLLQHKKIPAKKSDMVKHAMNGQTREFEDIFKDLESVLNQIFGMKVIGVGETQKSGLFSNYILISNYNLSVCDMVTPRDHDVDCRRSILFLILTVIFMLNRSIDEELVWKVMDDTKLNSLVCEKKDNLRRFLKQEYISTLYLNLEENNDNDPPIIRYSWGPRADKEFSKYSILKFVTKQFPEKKPIDFTIQYGIAKETEGELVAQDAAIEAREAEEGSENVPAVGGFLEDDDELLSQPFRLGNVNSDDEDDVLPQLPGESQESDSDREGE